MGYHKRVGWVKGHIHQSFTVFTTVYILYSGEYIHIYKYIIQSYIYIYTVVNEAEMSRRHNAGNLLMADGRDQFVLRETSRFLWNGV